MITFIGLVWAILSLICSVRGEVDFCLLTNQIKSFVVIKHHSQTTYLIEFDQFLLEYNISIFSRKILYEKSPKDQAQRFALCGNFQVACAHTIESYRSICHQEVYVFFDQTEKKFQFAFIDDLHQIVQALTNGSELPFIKDENNNKIVQQLSVKLSALHLKQRTPIAFDQIRSELYIQDNANGTLYIWNPKTDATKSVTTMENHISALVYLSSPNGMYTLLAGLDTLFVFDRVHFKPTTRTIKHLLECESVSVFKIQNLPFILSLFCIACLVGILFALCFMFTTIEQKYNQNFNSPKIK